MYTNIIHIFIKIDAASTDQKGPKTNRPGASTSKNTDGICWMSIEDALTILTSSGSSSGSKGNGKPINYVLIEDAGSGKSLSQDYRANKELTPITIKPKGDKEERFNGCLADVEHGHFLPAK